MPSLARGLLSKSIALHLASEVHFRCGCTDLRPPWDASRISLHTSRNGRQQYIYTFEYCYKCSIKAEIQSQVSGLSKRTDEKALFKCGHWSSRLPLEGTMIKLRWTLDGHKKDTPHYQWPIKCYGCERMYSVCEGAHLAESLINLPSPIFQSYPLCYARIMDC